MATPGTTSENSCKKLPNKITENECRLLLVWITNSQSVQSFQEQDFNLTFNSGSICSLCRRNNTPSLSCIYFLALCTVSSTGAPHTCVQTHCDATFSKVFNMMCLLGHQLWKKFIYMRYPILAEQVDNCILQHCPPCTVFPVVV